MTQQVREGFHTRVSMEVIVTIVSKLVYTLSTGRSNTPPGIIWKSLHGDLTRKLADSEI